MSELKRCPFCGGKAIIKKHPEWDAFQYEVKCKNPFCECALSAFRSIEAAAKAWNRRAET